MDKIKFLLILLFFLFDGVEGVAQLSVVFQVDMSYQVERGKFNPDTEWVEVAGTFNNWSGSGRFSDDDQDLIYELIISGFQAGARIAYKFRLNGRWDGREEFPGLGNDRIYTLGNDTTTLFHWYNNELPPDADVVADFHASTREFYEQGLIEFYDRSSGQVDSWEWMFEGGTPNSSNLKNPVVRYNSPGKYSVQLKVSDGENSNTVVQEDYLQVLDRNTNNIPWWNETVFYEIFVRSFKDSDGDGVGDFKGLIEKLDYLNDGDPNTNDDLGITGIWLMPIHEAGSYHGYDVIDYKSVSSDYGEMADFKAFLEEAHKRGIRVIIDFVMNHNSSQSEWFQDALTSSRSEFRNFYRWAERNPGYNGPWGQQVWHERNGQYYYGIFWDGMPDLNYQEPKVKEAMFEAADFWLEEIGIDGFRLDAVKYLVEEGQNLEDTQRTLMFWHDFNKHIKSINPDAFSVGEAWTNTEKVLNYVKNDRIDYCFEFDLAGNILSAVNEGMATNLYAQMQKMYTLYPHLQYGTFLANHDQNRIMNSLGYDESRVKLAAAIYLTLPGVPYIYYGEEIGMSGMKPDENIRRPMQWTSEKHAGFTSGTPWRNVQNDYARFNVEAEADDPASLLNWYRKLIHLRNREKSLQLGDYEGLPTNNSQGFAYMRAYKGEKILIIHNTGAAVIRNLQVDLTALDMGSGPKVFVNLLTDEDPEVFNLNNASKIELPVLGGRRTLVFKLSETVPVLHPEKRFHIQVYPNPVTSKLFLKVNEPSFKETDYFISDVQGKLMIPGRIDLSNQVAGIPVDQLPPGLYELSLFYQDVWGKIRFVKGE